jgi:hypothetical protein
MATLVSAADAVRMPTANAAEWARISRIEAARASHPATREFLLDLAAGYEAIAGEPANIHPDDAELQEAIADRLMDRARTKSAEGSV